MRRTHPILCFVGVLAALLCIHPARAAAIDPPEPVDQSVGRVPTSAEMVVVIDGLATARNIPAASGLIGVLDDLGMTDDLKPHWAALSGLLGWQETETLDRLLGSRIVLVVQSITNRKNTPWVIISEISSATDQRVKEKIPLAVRKAVDGVPVFALERGDYELATIRPQGQPEGNDRVMLLLGPAKRAALFDQMVRSVSKGAAGTLAGTPVVHELGGHTNPGVLVAVRVDPEHPGPPHVAWEDFLVCTAAPKGRAWECRLAIRDAEVRERVRRIEASSDAPYREMSKHAMLAVLETRLAAPGAEPTSFFEQFLSLFAIPRGAEAMLTGRQAFAVWPRGHAGKDGADAPATALCLAVAMETSDVQGMAPVADKHLGTLVAKIEKGMGGPGTWIPDFAGVSCQAVRSVPLELPPGACRIFDGQPQVAWSYPMASRPGTKEGWWQVCIGGAGEGQAKACNQGGGACADASHQMVEALLQPPAGGKVDRWVSVGSIRPTRWVGIVKMAADSFGAALPEAGNLVRVFQRIESVEWRLAARDNDDVAGTMRIEMVKPR